jgi:hypothetical protein
MTDPVPQLPAFPRKERLVEGKEGPDTRGKESLDPKGKSKGQPPPRAGAEGKSGHPTGGEERPGKEGISAQLHILFSQVGLPATRSCTRTVTSLPIPWQESANALVEVRVRVRAVSGVSTHNTNITTIGN